MEGTVVCRLREARRYLVFQQFLEYTVWGLFASLLVLAVSAAVSTKILSELCWLAAVGCPIALAGSGALRRWRFLERVGVSLDTRAKAKDRFVSALALPTNCAYYRGCSSSRWLGSPQTCVSEYLRPKIPPNIPWLLCRLGSGEGFYIWHSNELAPELTSAQKLLEEARSAAELEAKKEEEFKAIVEQLEKTQRELDRLPRTTREALRALAELERKLSGQLDWTLLRSPPLRRLLPPTTPSSPRSAQARAPRQQSGRRIESRRVAKALEQAARLRKRRVCVSSSRRRRRRQRSSW